MDAVRRAAGLRRRAVFAKTIREKILISADGNLRERIEFCRKIKKRRMRELKALEKNSISKSLKIFQCSTTKQIQRG